HDGDDRRRVEDPVQRRHTCQVIEMCATGPEVRWKDEKRVATVDEDAVDLDEREARVLHVFEDVEGKYDVERAIAEGQFFRTADNEVDTVALYEARERAASCDYRLRDLDTDYL